MLETPPPRYTLEPASASDKEWLFELYETTMRAVIDEAVGWDNDAQRTRFDENYRVEQFELILLGQDRAGALYQIPHTDRLHISLILIISSHQGQSLGTRIIEDLQRDCTRQSKALTLSTFKNNPALKLYRRLGFEVTNEDEHFFDLRYTAKPTAPP